MRKLFIQHVKLFQFNQVFYHHVGNICLHVHLAYKKINKLQLFPVVINNFLE